MKTFSLAVNCSSLKSMYDLFSHDLIACITLCNEWEQGVEMKLGHLLVP